MNTRGEQVSLCDSQKWKARGCYNPGPRGHILIKVWAGCQSLTKSSWTGQFIQDRTSRTVHTWQECLSLKTAPLRRCMAHPGLCTYREPRNFVSWTWKMHGTLDHGHPCMVHPLWTLTTHLNSVCLKCTYLSMAQLSKEAWIKDHFCPFISGWRFDTEDTYKQRGAT